MLKSKIISFLLLFGILVIGWFSVSYSFPKYTGQYLAMSILFLSDLYLWSAFRKWVFHYGAFWKVILTALFWLPMMLVLWMIATSLFIPFIEWNDLFRTYLIGFILVFYAAKIFPLFFLLMADGLRFAKKVPEMFKKQGRREIIERNGEGISRSKFLQYMAFLSGGLVLGTMVTGMFKWVYQFNIVKEKLSFSRLPKAFDGFRIVQISDMHLGSWKSDKPLMEAIAEINNLKADIILFTGDLVNFSTREAFRFEEILKKVQAKQGIYATLGNHDYGDYVNWPSVDAKKKNMQQLFAFYRRLGWKLMNNKHELIVRGKDHFALIGVENWGSHLRFPKYGDIDKATKGLTKNSFKVLMSHDPSHWDKIIIPKGYDMDITLSGHTHGFQFGIETKNLKWSPAQYVYKHWAGLYKNEPSNRYLYVNRGLGSIGYPGRIGILPEITLLELYSED